MLIKVADIFQAPADSRPLVRFYYILDNTVPSPDAETHADPESLLTASWIGRTPKRDSWYDVEIAVDDLIWGQNIFELEEADQSINLRADGTISLQGQLEVVYEDGLAVIRIGRSLLTCKSSGVSGQADIPVEFRTTQLTLYDTDTLRV